MKYIVILVSSLLLLSGCATSQTEPVLTQTAVSSFSKTTQHQPCSLSSSKSIAHNHVYDEKAYLRRISYNH